ncbi:unnamed protein product [Oppiella nova]|uniref:G-protein coupled receptors family 1 profile domain-containing protein n=1 Tax=Oppiella nova TaxID=334625 RepID=A0A7R9M8X9_9ACAR|nr:unnamed protein product [Oppiella nova]CAG2172686.1 unnamed protein product [Oppiella nova]
MYFETQFWEKLLEMNPNLEEELYEKNYWKNVSIITLYSLIFVISLLGNSLVIYIIFSKRRMRTVTNFYIANLTFADLLMTLINIPFSTARIILDNWPFGDLMCQFVPFIQVCSVYASTLTMCVISLDRHQAIIYPFGRRLSHVLPLKFVIPMIWILSSLLSLPHGYFNEVVTYYTYRSLIRCRLMFPEPQYVYRQWLTILTFVSQYVIPLSIATFSYCKIALHIHRRVIVGNSTPQQIANNLRQESILMSNRKTIKMLILVLVVFAVCWLPLNLYHLLADFMPDSYQHNFIILIGFHWFSMSSVCYNPFIYSARNSYFRESIRNFFRFVFCRCDRITESANNANTSPNTQYMSFRHSSRLIRRESSNTPNGDENKGSFQMRSLV